MSDQDRMNRADRIRRMREGERSDDESSADDEAADADPETSATGPDPSDGEPDESARVDAEPGDGSADTESAAESTLADEDVAAAVESVAGASAPVPTTGDGDTVDPREIEASSDDTDAAQDAVPAGAGTGAVESAGIAAGQGEEAESAIAASDLATGAATREDATRVLVFALEGEQYCLDIDYIEEIVKHESITRVPNTPEHVEGVVDMRGQITTIINPKVPIEKSVTDPGDLILVFDSEAFEEQGHLGWVVDDVRQVTPVTDDEVNESPGEEDYVNGVIDAADDEEFVVWTTPELALEDAT